MKRKKPVYVLIGSVFIGTWVLATASVGQQAVQGGASGASADPLSEIVVTAERHVTTVQKSSLAIQVLSADELKQAGVTDAKQLTQFVPGLQVSKAGSNVSIFIRGVGEFANNSVANPAVETNIDDMYIAREAAVAGQFYDIQRLEVLKGPQGTLYGRNATGGALNIITNNPNFDGLHGYLNSEFGNYATHNIDGALNSTINEWFAVRAAFQIVKHSGYLSDGSDDEDQRAFRLKGLWKPNDAMQIVLSSDYAHFGGVGAGFAVMPKTPGVPSGLSPWIGDSDARVQPALLQLASVTPASGCAPVDFNQGAFPTADGVTGTPNPGILTATPSPGLQAPTVGGACGPGMVNLASAMSGTGKFQDTTVWGVHAQSDWNMDFATLSVIPGYRSTDIRYLDHPAGYTLDTHETSKEETLEARLGNSADGFLKQWTTGVYYFHEDQTEFSYVHVGLGNDAHADQSLQSNSEAAFGQLTLGVVDDLRFIAGGRYTHDTKSIHGMTGPIYPSTGCSVPAMAFCPDAPAIGANGNPVTYQGLSAEKFAGNVSFNQLTWKFGLEYDLAKESLAYFNVSTGYKAGGLADSAGTQPYSSEKLLAYELGSKNRFFDDRLQLNLEVFLWKYNNEQVPNITTDSQGNINLLIENAGNATEKGFDLDLVFRPTHADTLHAGVEYLDSRFDRFIYHTAVLPYGNSSCNFVNVVSGAGPPSGDVDCSGHSLINAPLWEGTASWDHEFGLPAGATLVSHVDAQAEASRWGAIQFLDATRLPSSVIADVSLTYLPFSNRWSMGAYVRNVGNRASYATAGVDPFAHGFVTSSIGAPRTYGLKLGVKF